MFAPLMTLALTTAVLAATGSFAGCELHTRSRRTRGPLQVASRCFRETCRHGNRGCRPFLIRKRWVSRQRAFNWRPPNSQSRARRWV